MQDGIVTHDATGRLTAFPNVILAGHQAFFAGEALAIIAQMIINNTGGFEAGRSNGNVLKSEEVIWPTGMEKIP